MAICNPDEIDLQTYLNKENYYCKTKTDSVLHQGDIIIPFNNIRNVEGFKGKKIIGIIIITNQCDLEQNKAKFLTFIPIYRVLGMINFGNNEERNSFKEIVKQNHLRFFYLPPHPYIDDKLGGLIYKENIMTEKREGFKETQVSPKIRLKSPFIDSLSSKVAEIFNRIPVLHPEDSEIERWIETNEEIQKIKQLEDLLTKTSDLFTKADIHQWIDNNDNLEDRFKLMEIYSQTIRHIKLNEFEKAQEYIGEARGLGFEDKSRLYNLEKKLYIKEIKSLKSDVSDFIPNSTIKKWLKEKINLEKKVIIVRKYYQAQKYIKDENINGLITLFKDLNEIEDSSEERLEKLVEIIKEIQTGAV